MKYVKVAAVLLCAVLLFAGCRSEVAYSPDAVLTYRLNDLDVQVQLTEEEAKMVADLFNGKNIERWIDWDHWTLRYYAYGCPYDQNVTIRIADTIYYIASDGCGTVRIGEGEDVPYLELTREEEQKICDLFRKYTGLENPY